MMYRSENIQNGQIVLTGDRPTGPLHLGHYVGSLINRIALQNCYQQYIMLADMQALTDNFTCPEKITENISELVKGYLSVGIDPNKTIIFIQSQIPELSELTSYLLNLVTLNRLQRNPTTKAELKQKSFSQSIPVGFLCYPVSQAADITAFNADIVPVGDDQLPMIELTNEIVQSFNRIYKTNCLKQVKAYLSKTPRLVGIDGKAKASKSLGNAIFLKDEPELIKEKVFSMFTDPNHARIRDPGKIEGNVVFSYLDAFHANKEEVKILKEHYQRGGLGDITIKKILNRSLQSLLDPIREKRAAISQSDVDLILYEGTHTAKKIVQQTLINVRKAIGLNYF